MISRCLVALLLFMMISCAKKSAVPADVLPQAKMEAILWDLSRADQYSQDIIFKDTSKKVNAVNKELYQKVFSIHKISPQEFKKSYSFYQHHPDMLRTMLDSLQSKKTRETEAATMEIYNPNPSAKPTTIIKNNE